MSNKVLEVRNYEDLVKKVKEDNCMVIDNHDDSERKLYGVALLSNGTVGALIDSWCFCINELYLSNKDGRVHLSTYSVGGNVYHKDIEKYNEECTTKIVDYTIF